MRDRLVELIKQANKKCGSTEKCEDCSACDTGDEPDDCLKYNIADHLLANGVIVPPCTVGDTVYMILPGGKIHEKKVFAVTTTAGLSSYYEIRTSAFILCEGALVFKDSDIGTIVFLTREEAEQALKGKPHG